MKQFLDTIWGDGKGTRCVVSGKKYAHEFHTSNGAAMLRAEKHAKGKKDVWYGVSLLSGKRRHKDDVISTKAFWLDIDIKPDRPDCYHSVILAVTALRSFVDKYELPEPTVLQSGNGLHVYWILDTPVEPAKWHRIARALQMVCVEDNFLADGSITTDIARILRVPTTKNYKDESNPKSVELLTDIEITTYAELEDKLAQYIFKVELADAAEAENAKFAIELPSTPKDANAIAERCGQMRLLRDTRGDLPEPQWYAGLGVLALCIDGEDFAHEWSKGYSRYSTSETAAKFERAKEFAPTTCSKFHTVNPSTCQACPFFNKVVTPVQLGETVTPIEIPAPAPADANSEAIVAATKPVELPVPKPYQVGKEGVFLVIQGENKDDAPERQRIMEQPLWVSRLMLAEGVTGAEIEISWITARGQHRSANFDGGLLAVPQSFERELRLRGITFFWQIKAVIPYVNACINYLSRMQDEELVFSKFGYTEDHSGFVIGNDLIKDGARESARISGRIDAKRVRMCAEKGTLEGWRDAVQLFDQPQFWMHRFSILACLGTPLFAVAGNEGSILSLAGESSGGKTTAANAGIAAFGKPDAFTIDPQSTMKSFFEYWRQAGSLPVVINEAATIKREWMTILALAAANGTARGTMTQDSRLRDPGTWQTLTILTSNTHLLQLPESVLTDAARRRILELSFETHNLLPLSIGSPVNKAIEKNYGVAGRLFMDFVMSNRESIANDINRRVEALQKGVDSVHRYNVWLIATASVAADIATSLDIVRFDTEDCIKNALGTLLTQANEVKSPLEQVDDALADWLTQHQRDIGVKEISNTNAWIDEPFATPRGRYNAKAGEKFEVCVPVKQFRAYCLELGIDGNRIRKYMVEKGAVERGVRLARHSSNVRCYVLPYTADE